MSPLEPPLGSQQPLNGFRWVLFYIPSHQKWGTAQKAASKSVQWFWRKLRKYTQKTNFFVAPPRGKQPLYRFSWNHFQTIPYHHCRKDLFLFFEKIFCSRVMTSSIWKWMQNHHQKCTSSPIPPRGSNRFFWLWYHCVAYQKGFRTRYRLWVSMTSLSYKLGQKMSPLCDKLAQNWTFLTITLQRLNRFQWSWYGWIAHGMGFQTTPWSARSINLLPSYDVINGS